MPGSYGYKNIEPELILLEENLKELGINQDQLIVLGILVGTDYNYGGIRGIGPKKGLALVKKYGDDYDKIFEEAKWNEHYDFSWRKVFDTIKNINVTDDYSLGFSPPNNEAIKKLLADEYEFNEERVKNTLEKLSNAKKATAQKGLNEFFSG
jgi:flap endonuclease-1